MNYEKARYNMIEQQVRPWEVLDQRVLDALADLPRERFVPPAYRQLAYADTEILLDAGEVMMVPKVEARLAQELALAPTDRVLEVGTGSGYLTALLARLAGHVYSIEIVDALSRGAARTLEAEGITNVTLKVGNGARGWDEHAPYDAIAVTGSMPELDPDLARSLSVGGRLVAVVGSAPIMEAILVTRHSEDGWSRTSLFDTELPPLRGLPERETFEF